MSDQPPTNPPTPDSGEPPADSPYGNPPPPPASNPYAPPPATPPPGASPAPPPTPPPAEGPGDTTPIPAYGTPPPPAYSTPPPPPGYQAPTYAAPGYPAGGASAGHGGLAITALVFSIVALVLCWIPFLGVILALVGLVLGIIAWAGAGKANRPKGMGVAATIVSIVALLGAILITVIVVALWDTVVDCADPDLTQAQVDRCVEDNLGIES